MSYYYKDHFHLMEDGYKKLTKIINASLLNTLKNENNKSLISLSMH